MLRCFLFRYTFGPDSMRWFRDEGQPWAQQVFVMRMDSCELSYTGDDPSAVIYLPGLPQLFEADLAVEM